MINFKDLIDKAEQSENGEVYFTGVQEQEGKNRYIDPRTERDENSYYIVKPICFLNGHYWYICPNCEHIHMSEYDGKIQTACCDGDNQRFMNIGGRFDVIQYEPIILDVD